jgi:hypothetical protein
MLPFRIKELSSKALNHIHGSGKKCPILCRLSFFSNGKLPGGCPEIIPGPLAVRIRQMCGIKDIFIVY